MFQTLLPDQSTFELNTDKAIPTTVACHPRQGAEKVVVEIPGENGDLAGYYDKYVTLGDHVRDKLGVAFVRANNIFDPEKQSPAETLTERLDAVVGFVEENWQKLTGTRNTPKISLMGISAGASGCAANVHRYPNVQEMLLIAPGQKGGYDETAQGISTFSGKLALAFPENDTVIPDEVSERYRACLTDRTKADVFPSMVWQVPDCDHQFRGEINGFYMSALPIWAFEEDGDGMLSVDDGTFLYP